MMTAKVELAHLHREDKWSNWGQDHGEMMQKPHSIKRTHKVKRKGRLIRSERSTENRAEAGEVGVAGLQSCFGL